MDDADGAKRRATRRRASPPTRRETEDAGIRDEAPATDTDNGDGPPVEVYSEWSATSLVDTSIDLAVKFSILLVTVASGVGSCVVVAMLVVGVCLGILKRER